MDWNDVRYFLALARVGSVRAAGESLGVSHSTVARRVEALEVQLAARLFDRSREGYSLTAAGTLMIPGAERVEREMAELELELAGKDAKFSGSVRLTCCDQYVSEMMVQELTVFCGAYPGIELGITTDSRTFDLSKREADIAVRTLGVDSKPSEHLLGRKIVGVHTANYVATAHAHRLDPELVGKDTRWISYEERSFFESMLAMSSYSEIPPWGAFSSLALMMQATRAGMGIAMLPCYVADRDPSLRRLSKPDLRHMADLWLVSHPDLRDNARFRATRDCIVQALKQKEPLFSGQTPNELCTSG